MTGQGDKNFERIKKAKQHNGVLDVSLTFKTRNGCPVRNLRAVLTNKKVIGGRVITVANSHYIITGQVKVGHGWTAADWDANGNHVQEQYSLEQVKTTTTQSNLF